VTPKEKDAEGEEVRAESPESPPPEQTPFQRFEEFARRVISVSKGEIQRRERHHRSHQEIPRK
jgi:hypothetical protein